jgi:FKBP-type peptidyl-prolyl cis-trans isomerase SlyD
MIIENGCVVALRFRMTNDKGDMLDESEEGSSLSYLHGGAGILPALGLELSGKSAEDAFDITISSDEAFGEHQEDLIRTFPKSTMTDMGEVVQGMQINATSPTGEQLVGTVTTHDDENVTLDFNHPLAGMNLRFQGAVESVRAATDEERALGAPAT